MPPTTVRPAGTGDLPAVTAIFAHYVTSSVVTFEEIPPTVADWRHRLADLTGRGLGRALMLSLLERCAAAGVRQVVAVVVDDGPSASLALHRSLGFAEAGRLTAVGRKHGRWLDTVLLQLALPAPE